MPIKTLTREVFVPSPGPGIAILAASYHTTTDSQKLISIHQLMSRSDTFDTSFVRFSEDNGRTWGEAVEHSTRFEHPDGFGKRFRPGGFVDPVTRHYLSFWTEGVMPTDSPLDGMKHYKVHYGVSHDGGRTDVINEQVICEGEGYDAIHPLPGVTIGKNSLMQGDFGQRPLTRKDGVILLPVQVTPVGPDGEYYNPGGGHTYHVCQVLLGRWQEDGRLAWTPSERVEADPARSTRGLIEPTLAELADGTILMVMRGSNDRKPEMPGHRWFALSRDGGLSWTEPKPWTYEDGTAFHSPSSCSELLRHSDGRLFWMGNICEENPKGNAPRYPIILGEVDNQTGLLKRDTVTAIDDRAPEESPYLTLSNFYLREDLETGELVLHLARLFAQDFRENGKHDWTADAMLYRIAV